MTRADTVRGVLSGVACLVLLPLWFGYTCSGRPPWYDCNAESRRHRDGWLEVLQLERSPMVCWDKPCGIECELRKPDGSAFRFVCGQPGCARMGGP